MRAMRAEGFSGYQDLKLVDIPKPQSWVEREPAWWRKGGGTAFPVGSRVMFTGPYGVSENGTYSEWLAVRKELLGF